MKRAKKIAILSYLTIIGWIIAFIYRGKKETLWRVHLRQSFFIHVIMILGFMLPYYWEFVVSLCIIMIVLGLITVLNDEAKVLPVVGQFGKYFLKEL